MGVEDSVLNLCFAAYANIPLKEFRAVQEKKLWGGGF